MLTVLSGMTFFKAQKVFNQNYSFKGDGSNVAVVPIINDFEDSDSITKKVLKDTLQLKFMDVASARANLDTKVMDILKKVAEKDYRSKEVKTFPNLNTIISTEEISYIKEKFGNADLLLLPVIFNIQQIMGVTFGNSLFRLYDLNNGELIQQFSEKINVNIGDRAGFAMMTAMLISGEKSHLLHNIKK
ncbi:hypothetical protein F3J23_19060 [Chryseobacterium sp. Tr-659]|uniref:hypothetical protein n=1 Tax=Chryseobacterium sp. Tr-659 TaxID=2608340 RepID=UPI001424500D|nr:hypothetical protein [Chryseobacterium sp. Tr-659]NIF07526.1 hypothetical protein [Chryseobacterium sp. Tr-659]